jgi:hypothetical protein
VRYVRLKGVVPEQGTGRADRSGERKCLGSLAGVRLKISEMQTNRQSLSFGSTRWEASVVLERVGSASTRENE